MNRVNCLDVFNVSPLVCKPGCKKNHGGIGHESFKLIGGDVA